MIYLIDFPGYGTGNIFETEIYQKVMSICNGFIFVVRNSVIKENDTKKILDSMFTQAKEQKNKFSNRFIKSCLFIFNNDNKQTTEKKDLDIAKNDIKDIIKGLIEENINLTFFNAKYYSNYCSNYNYFFNLENLLKMEYNKFAVYQNNIFTYPELFTSKKYNTYGEYLYKELMDRVKNEGIGSGKVTKSQKVDKNVQEEINKIIKTNSLMNPNDYNKYGKLIEKVISYGQENINELKTLKQSNINEFKNVFKIQINYINEEMQEDIKEKIDEVISHLDLFFTERIERDAKEEELFRNKINDNDIKMEALIKSSSEQINLILKELKNNVSSSIESKKENINQLLNKKNYKDILAEINKEIFKNLEKLNQQIESYLDKYNSESEILIKESLELLKKYSKENKIILKNFDINFKSYFSKNVGVEKENMTKEIYNEIINSMKV